MENMLKQVRVRFSGQEKPEEPRSARQRRIPSLKTPSFKDNTQNKRPQNWFRRQFSGQTNQDYDSNRTEQAVAVAAAANAITSLNASSIPEQKKISKGPETSMTQADRKREGLAGLISESGKGSKSQDTEVPETATKEKTTSAAAPWVKRTLTPTDKPAPSMKKTPTSNESAEPMTDVLPIKPKITVPKPELPPTSKPAIPPTRPAIEDGTDADAWERAELSKIQKRYEQMNATILSWENKKKEKARKRLRKTEVCFIYIFVIQLNFFSGADKYLLDLQSDLERIRSRALKQFHDDIVDIDQIAGGAKAKAAERQRNEEFKAKEKANTIRKTGKLPRTCFCF
ncbi:remorin 1.4 isoform X2 [Populus trichocarpa]|uniref:remorin 1.4 isoform X2 n=1 Tax=Populus trichocarpa TaxID=3694 RepID=UPI00227842AC|nr:remorin 1.4 isoform X2 [Populus trichocarpa]